MCDVMLRSIIAERKNFPNPTYKVVQVIGEGKYLTTVAGFPLYLKRWATAKDGLENSVYDKAANDRLVRFNPKGTRAKRLTLSTFSWFSSTNCERFSSFEDLCDAEDSNLVANFCPKNSAEAFPQRIVECEVDGEVRKACYAGEISVHRNTVLSTRIRVVRELKELVPERVFSHGSIKTVWKDLSPCPHT